MMQTAARSNGWRIEDAEFVVICDGLKPPNGCNLFDALGISVAQNLKTTESCMINYITAQCPFKLRRAKQFRKLVSRFGFSKIHIVKPKFHKVSNLNVLNMTTSFKLHTALKNFIQIISA